MLRTIEIVMGMLLALTHGAAAQAPTATDSAAVRRAALDYIEGWYEADAAGIERAVHPDLAKPWIRIDDTGLHALHHTSAARLIEQTRRGGGSKTTSEERRNDVKILDLYSGMASVRATSARYVDYIHLALEQRVEDRKRPLGLPAENQ